MKTSVADARAQSLDSDAASVSCSVAPTLAGSSVAWRLAPLADELELGSPMLGKLLPSVASRFVS